MCEDSKIGISLIFTVQNGIEYMRECQAGFPADPTTSVTLSGLALSGMILLPVSKDEKSVRSEKKLRITGRCSLMQQETEIRAR